MLHTKIEISKKRIRKVHIDILPDLSGGFQLKVESRVQVKTPKKEEKTVLVLIEMSIRIPDSEDIDIVINAEFIFQMDEVPSEYNELVEERCVPMAQEDLFIFLDGILVEMGYEKLRLAEQ